jgi:hypothetical protein
MNICVPLCAITLVLDTKVVEQLDFQAMGVSKLYPSFFLRVRITAAYHVQSKVP